MAAGPPSRYDSCRGSSCVLRSLDCDNRVRGHSTGVTLPMSNKYDTFESYIREVQTTAKRYYDYAREGGDEIRCSAFDPDELPDDVPLWAIAEAAVENHELIQYYQRCVIYHAEEGFYNEGGERFYHDPEDQQESVQQLALAGFYNDIITKLRFIEETREDLGEAIQLLEGPLHSRGVRYEYDYYIRLSSKDPVTYTLEALGQGEWRMYDPDGEPFEVISPRVAVENADRPIPEYSLKLFLDNICARRERERETSE
ncbi:hypothetical protein M1M41_gp026 [Halorubrum sodomense tailed virus 4]|uniref:Uncharacterized protein n=1 Tax=Halorubrum sodomense tailed virus 4 TaxID=2878013 RepID=A0AAE9BVG6_9CAUD|nr:hypothetical protein M1M41_gp026 [Halorubrum sodomense tailed virus 4]UBF20305.1 hypothetical protein HSTV-4_gp98 [Halorubrum sodomense tailed virus 4]UBF21994.1 hypothetical protein HJTV-3_gp105 [Haloarcula virus HJTV-3]UBF22123.1 hypothetical protein HRTV-15_gp104 [Halorubrum virus HRTV-15]